MKFKLLFFLLAVFFLSACGTAGKATKSAKKVSSIEDVITYHNKATPNFNTLAARVQVVYEDEKKSQSITASLRMEKDKIIWIKASILGITLAKVLITPDRVQYYESISGSYFDGDFTLLSEVLGTDIDFEKAQNILLGQSVFALNARSYNVKLLQARYKILPKQQQAEFIVSLFLNQENFKVHSESVAQPSKNRLLTVNYGEYQEIDGSFFPSEIKINASENEDKTRIELNYKKIDLNVSINFPFDIPNGYEEIQLR
ncbi:DUF4292 domain-containing protein [Ulvibacter antarcticus]|nr:DUF4292 domain-containing protein [Ulvibacter antarcticus]